MKNADIEKRDYDVFKVWGVDEKGLSVPESNTDETLTSDVEDVEDEENETVASVFGNEYIPLVMQARDRGIDVADRFEVSKWLSTQAEELNDQSYRDWAVYSEKMSDDDWRMFIGQYLGDNRVAVKKTAGSVDDILASIQESTMPWYGAKDIAQAYEWAVEELGAPSAGDKKKIIKTLSDEGYDTTKLSAKKTAADVSEAVNYMQSFVEPTSPNEEVEKAFNQVVREMNLSGSEQAEMRMLLGELGYWGGFEMDAFGKKKQAYDAMLMQAFDRVRAYAADDDMSDAEAIQLVVRQMELSDADAQQLTQLRMRDILGKQAEVLPGSFYTSENPEAMGLGPGGECVCSTCGYKDEHDTGESCFQRICTECGESMTRVAHKKTADITGPGIEPDHHNWELYQMVIWQDPNSGDGYDVEVVELMPLKVELRTQEAVPPHIPRGPFEVRPEELFSDLGDYERNAT